MRLTRHSVAYNVWNYNMHRKDQIRPASSNIESELIGWILKPPAKVAFQDNAAWNEPEVRHILYPMPILTHVPSQRWAPWDEQ